VAYEMFHHCSIVAALTALARSGAARREVEIRTIASGPMGWAREDERRRGGRGLLSGQRKSGGGVQVDHRMGWDDALVELSSLSRGREGSVGWCVRRIWLSLSIKRLRDRGVERWSDGLMEYR
jgi:hypothetical protein